MAGLGACLAATVVTDPLLGKQLSQSRLFNPAHFKVTSPQAVEKEQQQYHPLAPSMHILRCQSKCIPSPKGKRGITSQKLPPGMSRLQGTPGQQRQGRT